MGIDFLDIRFRLEKEFTIQLTNDNLNLTHSTARREQLFDFQVVDIVNWVTFAINEQNPSENTDVLIRIHKQISDCLGIDQIEVKPESWLNRDLGME